MAFMVIGNYNVIQVVNNSIINEDIIINQGSGEADGPTTLPNNSLPISRISLNFRMNEPAVGTNTPAGRSESAWP